MDCNKIYLKMDRYETVVFCNDYVNVYVLCGKAEGKDIYIDFEKGEEVIEYDFLDILLGVQKVDTIRIVLLVIE